MLRRLLRGILILVATGILVVGGGCGNPTVINTSPVNHTATATLQTKNTATAAIQTVFLIMMENHNWSEIKNSPSAPYINHTLLPMASYAEQYYIPPGNHPSEPNYLWLEAGTNLASVMTLTRTPIIRARHNILSPC
ncbi:MAG: hypothetical protein ACJ788_12310 [Ktedonobacteraceae bacterium]